MKCTVSIVVCGDDLKPSGVDNHRSNEHCFKKEAVGGKITNLYNKTSEYIFANARCMARIGTKETLEHG